ncbi:MAG TPA: HD-GYP domain-containing protein [Candidatus Limnocylindria bacterium]|nr:HD-GYP domain-containing protein [Candidatus Limnocylindria bacterium]
MRDVRVTGWSPVARFSIALGLTLAVTALVLAGATALVFGRYVEDETARFTKDAVRSHFGTVFDEAVFSRTLDAKEWERLEQTVLFHFSVYGIVSTRFFDPSGRVVFSYDDADLGMTAQGDAAALLARTLAGDPPAAQHRDIVADMRYGRPAVLAPGSYADSHAHPAGGSQPDVRRATTLETWVPVVEDGRTVGAAVVWRDLGPIEATLRQIQASTALIIATAAVLLWLFLRGVYVRSSQRIVAQSAALERALGETERTYDSTLHALSNALDVRDTETEGHARRVLEYMELIADELGLADQVRPALRRGALLHDIGKIGVPDQILRKPGPLNDAEWTIMRRHPDLGARIIARIPFLEEVATIIRSHHERWDGAGYPEGLAGSDIPLGARIFAVADAFDAMTSDRPYRLGRSIQQALGEIVSGRGTQFDPGVVDAFLAVPRSRLEEVHANAPFAQAAGAAV